MDKKRTNMITGDELKLTIEQKKKNKEEVSNSKKKMEEFINRARGNQGNVSTALLPRAGFEAPTKNVNDNWKLVDVFNKMMQDYYKCNFYNTHKLKENTLYKITKVKVAKFERICHVKAIEAKQSLSGKSKKQKQKTVYA